jgi:hypothetical protein
MIKKAYFIQMVATVWASVALSQTGIVEKIRSMEGEWIIISDAATTVPQTNYMFVVQNDVCGKITVACTQFIEDKKNYGPFDIQTIVVRYGNTLRVFQHPQVLMYPAEKDGETSPFYVGSYDSTNNCIEWSKNSGLDKRYKRWRFSDDNMFFVRESWSEQMSEWRIGNTLCCRKTAKADSQKAAAILLTGGLRDSYGNMVGNYVYKKSVAKDYTNNINHVPEPIFFDDEDYIVNASNTGRNIVTQALVEVHFPINIMVGDPEKIPMRCIEGTSYSACISNKNFNSYSISFFYQDGSTNNTPWIRPFKYPPTYKRVDFKRSSIK